MKPKVLLVVNIINDYRVETYNIINQHFDFTVGYNVEDQSKHWCDFKKIKFNTRKIGPFNFFGKSFWQECKKYDAVITSFDLHNFEFAFIPFIKRNYKLLTWSIGIRCSYTRRYNVDRKIELLDKFVYKILQKADANIFYMAKALDFWRRFPKNLTNVFVAPNTTTICPIKNAIKKDSIIFVGTLYKGKGVDLLIRSFQNALTKTNSDTELYIVGKGEEKENLESLTKDLGINNRVVFCGPIYEEEKLSKLFAKSIICVSPTQAGLTVPKSMGYGVPVITHKDAITGGEIYHISNGETGIIFNTDEELDSIIEEALTNPEKFICMGNRAKQYYKYNATPTHQAQGVIDAINYSLQK